MRSGAEFATRLRWWRQRRGWSQLELAGRAGISQRHLSFLEIGRATPSRGMVLRVAATMDLPLRQQNALLLAAGYAPAWGERDLAVPELTMVNRALDYMLAQHEPYPAFVVDRVWNLLRANRGAARLTEFLTGAASPATEAEPVNLALALMSPDGLRPCLANWPEVALYFLRGVQADAHADGRPEIEGLLARLRELPDVAALAEAATPPEDAPAPVLPMHFRRDATSLRLFTTIATLGTPRDVTLQEIRVECFFPMDEATAAVFRDWAAHADQPLAPAAARR